MIKLIASDLDGTLLDPAGKLPNDVFPLLSVLEERGILFLPASGRQHHNLKKLFAPFSEKLVTICENGALVRRGDETLFRNPLSDDRAAATIRAVRQYPSLDILLCCENTAYIESKNASFRAKAHASYSACEEVDDLEARLGKGDVCKVSVYDTQGAANYAGMLLPPLLSGVKLVVSGAHWCDIVAPNTDKKNALVQVQALYHLAPEECMAFGDQMNDLGMFEVCAHTRAVKNAVPEVLAAARKIIPSNVENGVVQELTELIEGDFYV